MTVEKELTPEVVALHDAVLFTEGTRETLAKWSDFCHNHKPKAIAFVAVLMRGPLGALFSDMGPSHTIVDQTGQERKPSTITHVSHVQTIASPFGSLKLTS